jgi:hypothetical protein
MSDARAKIRQYRRQHRAVQAETKRIDEINQPGWDACTQYTDVQCPSPRYPDQPTVPDVSTDIRRLHSASKRLDVLHASILNVGAPPQLKVFFAQLATAVDALNSDATYNADTLTKGITPPDSAPQTEGDSSKGYMDDAQVNTLHDEQALPAVKEMNRAAMAAIGLLRLQVSEYDLPGGNDLDPGDHSLAT